MNFIIDLGGVVVTWQPDLLLAQQFADPVVRSSLKTGFIEHPDWIELDRGTLSRQEAISRAADRTGVAERDVKQLLCAVPPALVLIPETIAILYRLRAQGHALYCLSNMHAEFIGHLEDVYDFWDVFTGVVVSCRVQFCKPEPEIFEHLLTKFSLTASETLLIDDTLANQTAASALGMQTILFKHPTQCELQLKRLGYL